MVFLEASEDTLVRRFDSERRPHPLQGAGRVTDGIAAERDLLRGVRGDADLVIDTSRLNVHELRARMRDFFSGEPATGPGCRSCRSAINTAFRSMPTSWRTAGSCRTRTGSPELAPMTGQDAAVRELHSLPAWRRRVPGTYAELMTIVLPGFEREGKRFVTLAVGCTGGKHRSVAIAEQLWRGSAAGDGSAGRTSRWFIVT